jgi:hypothetical chaperone protein
MTDAPIGLGIDFGTTNSVIAVADAAGRVHAMTWADGADATPTYRTALAFRDQRVGRERVASVAAGPRAIAWALDPTDNQRFVQSIKTHLGSHAFRETRIHGRRYSLQDLIALFLRRLVADAALPDGALPAEGAALVAGRPVIFAGERPDEALAVERLTAAFADAGFGAAEFAYEPLGAAYWYARGLKRPETALVADFGGGTSDFSVVRFEPGSGEGDPPLAQALAHDGVGVAGDTFDFRIIDHAIAPQLGKDARYRSGDKWLAVPQHFFAAFSRWHRLSWLKDAKVLSDLDAITEAADEPEKLARLRAMIDYDLGLDLYAAVTAAKTRLSSEEEVELRFDKMGVRLGARITRAQFDRWIAADIAAIAVAMERALARAGVSDMAVDAVFMTGGTSYVPAVRRLFVERFGEARIHIGEAFQSVASGLALMARDRAMAGAPAIPRVPALQPTASG